MSQVAQVGGRIRHNIRFLPTKHPGNPHWSREKDLEAKNPRFQARCYHEPPSPPIHLPPPSAPPLLISVSMASRVTAFIPVTWQFLPWPLPVLQRLPPAACVGPHGRSPLSPTGFLVRESPWVMEWIQRLDSHSQSQDVEVNAVGERNPVKSKCVLQGVKGRGGDANPKSHYKS